MAKESVVRHDNITTQSGLSAKSITGIHGWVEGSTVVIEISYSGGSTFLKVKNSILEYGGTASWGTGTKTLT